MNTKYLLWIWVIGLFIWSGCNDDSETLTSSEKDEYRPILGTGHDYDEWIQEFYDSTGVYIIYQFEPAEIYANGNSQWAGIFQDTIIRDDKYYSLGTNVYVDGDRVFINGEYFDLGTTQFGYSTTPWFQEVTLTGDGQVRVFEYSIQCEGTFSVQGAEEEYVGKQLDWVNETFLHFYPKSLLRETMPMKMILGRGLIYNAYPQAPPSQKAYYYSFHNLIFSYGDRSIDTLGTSTKSGVKADVNYWYITERLESLISLEEFGEVSATAYSSRPSYNQCYGYGLLFRPTSGTYTESIRKRDFQAYITAFTKYSREQLESEPANGDFDTSGNYTGILHKKKDTEGRIRRKYEILLKEFEKLGVDLQAIGDLYNKE